MIQFNLLPDIKIQYIRARRQKQMVVMASTITIVASVAVMVGLISMVFVVQKKSISDLSGDIKVASQELQSTPDLTKMLTVQNQLTVLPGLHSDKPVVSRIFGYVTQSTPAAASISKLNVDFESEMVTVSGAADSLETINVFADSLKFTTYHTQNEPEVERQAFSSVVLASFGRDTQGASYTITFSFDPEIFRDAEEITLTVPDKVTTRSQTEQPAALFQQTEDE